MEKLVRVVGTVSIFVVFFAVLEAWDLNGAVRVIFSAIFAAAFGVLVFGPSRKKTTR